MKAHHVDHADIDLRDRLLVAAMGCGLDFSAADLHFAIAAGTGALPSAEAVTAALGGDRGMIERGLMRDAGDGRYALTQSGRRCGATLRAQHKAYDAWRKRR